MLSIRRGTDRPGSGPRRRAGGPLVAALALNALLTAVFVGAIHRGYTLDDLLGVERERRAPAERVEFVPLTQLPNDPARPPAVGRSGGDGRPVGDRPPRPAPQLRAPTRVPDGVPAPPVAAAPPADAGGGSGEIVGSGGPTVGIRPNLGDARVWARPGVAGGTFRTQKQRADSVLADLFTPVRDSIARAQALAEGQRKPGDWTVQGKGGTWGLDPQYIHLGKVKVPSAVLALLSESFQRSLAAGHNASQAEYNRRLSAIRADIAIHSEREMNEDQFRDAVKQVRARKDRERRQRIEEQERARATVAGGDAQPQAPSTPAGAAPPR
ncbi:MAG TPA: hypothetical protein VEZ47_04910 [Gemmatirosa sp.]|nr:hypothetical protein [Gemmatirosa sp.]